MSKVWRDRRVLITGAGGFIGSHLTERLTIDGAKVRAFIHYNSRGDLGLLEYVPREVLAKIEIYQGDLLDINAMLTATCEMDIIIHLGALIGIPYSYKNPTHVIQTNILGTMNVLEAARHHNISRVIHTSTSEVYGTAQFTPITEDHPLRGQSPYSASKIGADSIIESYYRSFNLPVATIRPFNTYGPRQSARAVIPSIIIQALTRDKINLGNLDATRDFTFVSDIVEGFLRASTCDDAIGVVTNLGSGSEISIKELAEKIIVLIGRDVPIIQDDERLRPQKSEVERLIADYRMARDRLGWSPQVSLTEGLKNTIQWINQNIHRFHPEEYQT